MIHHWTPPIVLLRLYSSFPSFASRTALQNCPPNATSPSIFLALRSPQALAWLSTPLSAPACAHLAGFASRQCSAHPAGPHLVWPPLPGLRNDYKHVKHEILFSNHFSQYYKILNITNMYLVISQNSGKSENDTELRVALGAYFWWQLWMVWMVCSCASPTRDEEKKQN